jgi:hypothetical protein
MLALGAGGQAAAGEADLPAFPGAEGFGASSKGGRGGRVIKVTNLNAEGPGSFQAACAAKGPRIIVFDVSGVIRPRRGKYPSIGIGEGRITIAGQTAPGAGITVLGMLRTSVDYRAPDVGYPLPGLEGCRLHDVTIRFLRIRPPTAGGSGGDCLQFARVNRLIVDHVSCSGASDETVDINGCRNYTIQWCSIEASDTARGPNSDPWARRVGKGPLWNPSGTGPHNFGMILGYGRRDASLHHTLFAHHNRRTPLCGMDILDHRNNVIYDVFVSLLWHPAYFNRLNPGKPFRANVVANYFKDGPSCPPKYPTVRCRGARVYAEGNHFVGGRFADGKGAVRPAVPEPMPFPAPPVTTHTAEDAYKLVLAHAGCLPRDAIGKRNVEETRKATGSWGRYDPAGGMMAGLEPGKPPEDSDDDGMPDAWETAHDLDPKDPKDAGRIVPAGASKDDRHKGYTWIEFYINERADKLVAKAVADAGVADIRPDPTWTAEPPADLAVPEAARMLAGDDRRGRRIAAQTLAAADPEKAVPILLGALNAKNAESRMAAIWALGRIGPPAAEAVPSLVKALDGEAAPPRDPKESSVTRLRREKRSARIREYTARALANIGPRAVPALIRALGSSDPETRIAAARALGRMGPKAKEAVPALSKQFADEHPWARAHAALAVFRIAPGTHGLVEALAGSLGEDPGKAIWKDWRARGLNIPYRLVWALGYLGPRAKTAVPKLEEVVKWRYGNHKIHRPIERVTKWALGRIGGTIPMTED